MIITLLLAMQAPGQEITTVYPLPSQKKPEQAQQQKGDPAAQVSAAEEAKPVPKPAEPAEEMKVLKVREVPPTANVIFVPPPAEEAQKPD